MLHISDKSTLKELNHMLEQEAIHEGFFSSLASSKQVRPTVFSPLWNIACMALGKVTAIAGKDATFAAINAIEEVIENHYQDQITECQGLIKFIDTSDSKGQDPSSIKPDIEILIESISKFKEDEAVHKDAATWDNASTAGKVAYGITKQITALAVAISKRW
jgi:ubiquinone biosynthesis monooxygenase Coq7